MCASRLVTPGACPGIAPVTRARGLRGCGPEADLLACTRPEQLFGDAWIGVDPRVGWLCELLAAHRGERFLLICGNAETARTLEEHLRTRRAIRSALFHEAWLVARDRAAAYFAQADEPAQILVSSEIGSEGRNFQFASHLVLFDLPLNPDLLEQRIGRLDRIGQKSAIQIHVPHSNIRLPNACCGGITRVSTHSRVHHRWSRVFLTKCVRSCSDCCATIRRACWTTRSSEPVNSLTTP